MIEAFSEIQLKDVLLVLMGSGITIVALLLKVIQEYLKKYKLVTTPHWNLVSISFLKGAASANLKAREVGHSTKPNGVSRFGQLMKREVACDRGMSL